MSKKFVEKQHKILLAILERLSGKRPSFDMSGNDGQYDLADIGSIVASAEQALASSTTNSRLRRDVELALKRIEKGTYGVCELTGEEISEERLEAVPWARFTVKAQAEVEKNHNKYGKNGQLFDDSATEENSEDSEENSEETAKD